MSRRWVPGATATTAVAALLITSFPAAANAAARAGTSTPATTVSPAKTASPAKVSNALFRAWNARDRAAAARVATPSAVRSIFAYVYRTPDVFAGCAGNACRFTHTSVRVPGGHNGLLLVVSGSKVTRVYQSRHVTRPSTAAGHLFRAWQKGDRNLGLEVAAKPAVTTLFRVRFDPRGVPYFFQGCTKEKTGYGCAYSYEGGAMFMRLKGSAVRGYEVRSIDYLAD
ncbi:hypothetical protein [Nonomuraea cavernae]|uniref:hypothetical protein n=1 Tax=Nonomuraea cavernae TaxID=2045107 RepID=UPI001668455D|nr:hypothetical protein [Nonomuraea cavernae]MCA2185576.1 hypothetical protein [Nonomuraea cavernae]